MIHKIQLTLSQYQHFSLPLGAKCLKIGLQGHSVCMWYIFDSATSTVPHTPWTLECYPSGVEIPDVHKLSKELNYIETVILHDGTVWHYFLRKS